MTGMLLMAAFLVSRCDSSTTEKSDKLSVADSASSCAPTSVNPNGDSELSLLMRKMLHSSESLKQMVNEGRLPNEFPEEFLKIHTAKPTDDETKKESYDGHASNYIYNLKELYASPKEDLQKNYNAMINSCVSCHNEHCPGPLRAIEKLKI